MEHDINAYYALALSLQAGGALYLLKTAVYISYEVIGATFKIDMPEKTSIYNQKIINTICFLEVFIGYVLAASIENSSGNCYTAVITTIGIVLIFTLNSCIAYVFKHNSKRLQ